MLITIIAFLIGVIVGKLKINFNFTLNKITRMRKRINNKSWVLSKYEELMKQEKENEHFYRFECGRHFVGDKMKFFFYKTYKRG